jgi:hypothetical protein
MVQAKERQTVEWMKSEARELMSKPAKLKLRMLADVCRCSLTRIVGNCFAMERRLESLLVDSNGRLQELLGQRFF